MRRKGKFERVSAEPLSYAAAIELGIKKTDITSAATFRLQPKGFVKAATRSMGLPTIKLKQRYYQQKPTGKTPTKQLTFIEKPKYRISTYGEKREITFKGIQAQQEKRKRKRWW